MKRHRYGVVGLVVAVVVAVLAMSAAYAAEPVFTDNGVPGATVFPGDANVLAFDLTMPAQDVDVFLDGDGATTGGSGSADAVSAGTPFVSFFPNSVCGNTDGTTPPTKLRFDANFDCVSIGDGFIILGIDAVGTTFNLGASVSRVRFVDIDSDGGWDDGEDIYFDADDSWLYNADVLDALTVRNAGTAVVGADVAAVKLWRDANSNGAFETGTDVLLGACAWDGINDWECDVNFVFTSAPRVFVAVDIASGAISGRTIQLQVIAFSDAGTLGAFNSGDTGIFFASNHDGPAIVITNGGVHTIATPAAVKNCVFESPITNADFALKDGTTLPIKFHCLDSAGNVLTTVQDVALNVTGPNALGIMVTYVFSIANGTLTFDPAAIPPHYAASFSTKTYSVKDGGHYMAEVKAGTVTVASIEFDVFTSSGTARGNSGK